MRWIRRLVPSLTLLGGCVDAPTSLQSWVQEPDDDFVAGPPVPASVLVDEVGDGLWHAAVVIADHAATCDGFLEVLATLDALEAATLGSVRPEEDGAWACDRLQRGVADRFGPQGGLTALHLLAGDAATLVPGTTVDTDRFVAAGWESGPAGGRFGRATPDRCAGRVPDALRAGLPHPLTAALPRLRNPQEPWAFEPEGAGARDVGIAGALAGDAAELTLGLLWNNPDGGALALWSDGTLPLQRCPGLAAHTARFWELP